MDHPGAFTSSAVKALMARAMFYRVLGEVLGIDDDDLLMKALDGNGIASLHDLVGLSDYQIDTMSFDDGTGVWLLPSLASRNKIRVLRSWHSHLQLVQGRREVDWMDLATVNEDEWDDYRVGVYVPSISTQTKSTVWRASSCRRMRNHTDALVPVSCGIFPSDAMEELGNGEPDNGEGIGFGIDEIIALDSCMDMVGINAKTEDDENGTSKGESDRNGDIFNDSDGIVTFDAIYPFETSASAIGGVGFAQEDLGLSLDIDFVGITADCCAEMVISSPNLVTPVFRDVEMNNLVDWRVNGTLGIETNIVFDPGGGVGDWDEFFGCDWFTPAPEQYLDLLLLDRGE